MLVEPRGSAAQPAVVYLVGAGPGDPELLTVRGRTLLDSCDAVVYDALVAPELIGECASRQSPPELYFVGKRGGDGASTTQDEINTLLVRLGTAQKSVVRLKGGDPFVFGRGGEEAEVLAGAGVLFEIVPGVTAGVAGPAYAGIPVTHRGLATTVTFVTGHEDPAKGAQQTDWAALARAGGTLVLYMGVRALPRITATLAAEGMSPDTPAAAVQSATTPAQRVVQGTLSTIAERVRAAGLDAPVITVIGRVVELRDVIGWYDRRDRRPLFGRRILVTRATARASSLSQQLRALGAAVMELPATRTEPLDPTPLRDTLAHLHDYRHLVFTSQQAVSIVWEVLRESGRDARALAGIVVSAVGPATAGALLEHGIAVDLSPRRFVAEGLLESLRERQDVSGGRVLYPAAEGARDALPEGLRALGATVDVVPIYRSVVDGRSAEEVRATIAADALDLVTFTSASSVHGYVEAVGLDLARQVPAACIGPVTSEAARRARISVAAEAEPSTIAGLIAAIVPLWPAESESAPVNRAVRRRAPRPSGAAQ